MKNLLLVEDNAKLMDINREFLEDSGYSVTAAFSLAEAEERISERLPDLIVLDIMLPDGDGIEFCRKLRLKTNVPVLFLSAKSNDSDIIEGLRRGGDDYMTKPYNLSVFLAHIEALLRRSGMQPDISESNTLTAGPIVFDLTYSQVFVSDTLLTLAAKEYGILLCLARNANREISKEELYRSVWGQDMHEDSTALWTAVSRLKKKITPYGSSFFIESTHSGYTLVIV